MPGILRAAVLSLMSLSLLAGCGESGSNSNDPVISVDLNDPALKAAEAEARRRWPEFVAAHRSPKPGQGFAVKSPFPAGDQVEYMWVQVESIDGNTITGTLDNNPQWVKNLKAGDGVTVKADEINDWMIHLDGEFRGGFTIKVVEAAAKEQGKKVR